MKELRRREDAIRDADFVDKPCEARAAFANGEAQRVVVYDMPFKGLRRANLLVVEI